MASGMMCANCDAPLTEDSLYCRRCGERPIQENEYALAFFLKELFHRITHLDGRFFQSIKGIVKPGFLSQEYFAGRRKAYMRPLQFFLICNVLFFLITGLTKIDTFDYPLIAHVYYVPYAPYAMAKVSQKLDLEPSISQEDRQQAIWTYAPAFQSRMTNLSKTLVILMLPMLALLMWGFFFGMKSFFAQHLIISTHFLSFVMLYQAMIVPLFLIGLATVEESVLGLQMNAMLGRINYAISFFPTAFLYVFLMFKRLFVQNIWLTLLKTGIFLFFLSYTIMAYNFFLFHISLWTT